jgi:uncharacterized protein YjbI with pentapeptide repeats
VWRAATFNPGKPRAVSNPSLLLELLASGRVEEFNARRSARSTVDLFAADLAGASLGGADLSNANLEKADLTEADLAGVSLARATLDGADLGAAVLVRAIAIKARFRECYLAGATLDDAQLAGADFSGADLAGASLQRVSANGARFNGAQAARADFEGADLAEAKFQDADLRDVDMAGVVLREAKLERATLDGAMLEEADLTGAKLAGAALRNAHLARARLDGADLSGADLAGADLDGASFDGADLSEAVVDPDALGRARITLHVPAGDDAAPGGLHFDEPSLASQGDAVAALWENAEEEDQLVLRLAIASGGSLDGKPLALPLPAEQILARAVLPSAGGFRVAALVERPGGVDVTVVEASGGKLGAPRSTKLGYLPAVKPVFQADGDGFMVFGIGRNAGLTVHRWEDGKLAELLCAPAGTYRGFCGRNDPVLLGKGGTVAAVRADGISRLRVAPSGYPGRLVAAATRADADGEDEMALAWVGKEQRGVRVLRLGVDDEPLVIAPEAEVGALELCWDRDHWCLAFTAEGQRERDHTLPYACTIPAERGGPGKPVALLTGDDEDDVEDIRAVIGDGALRLGLVTLAETLVVVEVGGKRPRVIARLHGE